MPTSRTTVPAISRHSKFGRDCPWRPRESEPRRAETMKLLHESPSFWPRRWCQFLCPWNNPVVVWNLEICRRSRTTHVQQPSPCNKRPAFPPPPPTQISSTSWNPMMTSTISRPSGNFEPNGATWTWMTEQIYMMI